MAQTYQGMFLSDGDTVNYTPASAVVAGQVVVQGGLIGIAPVDIAANVLGQLKVRGPHRVVKVNGAFTGGQALYWDADGSPQGGVVLTGALTGTATANTFAGYAIAAAAETAETVDLWLVPTSALTQLTSTANAITDPGNAGAIPITQSGRVALVTTGAETRTLAAPATAGLQLLIYFKTDGGDCVVTCATTFNETGNNTATFTDTGEVLWLVSVEEGSNFRWRTALTDGAALTTV